MADTPALALVGYTISIAPRKTVGTHTVWWIDGAPYSHTDPATGKTSHLDARAAAQAHVDFLHGYAPQQDARLVPLYAPAP